MRCAVGWLDVRASFSDDVTMATKQHPDAPEPSFEEALKKLEEVVLKLEKGDIPLEQSLAAYEEGIALVRAAQGRLDGMDQRLEQLLHDGKTIAPLKTPEG